MLKFRWFKFSWLSNISSFYLWPKRFSGQTPHPGLLSIFQTLTCKGYNKFDICTFHKKNFGQKNYHANSIHNIFVEMTNLSAEIFNSDFIHIQNQFRQHQMDNSLTIILFSALKYNGINFHFLSVLLNILMAYPKQTLGMLQSTKLWLDWIFILK